MIDIDMERLRDIAEVEFADIVMEVLFPDINELRMGVTIDCRKRWPCTACARR
jgi:hypothetical protein